MEKVEVYVKMSGDYCAFHEASVSVVYDITNKKHVGWGDEEDLETYPKWDYNNDGDGYSDVTKASAIIVDGKYFIDIDSL